MFPELTIIQRAIRYLRDRLAVARAETEAGYSTEAVIVIALLSAMAIAAVAIIAAKVLAKANSVDTGP
ncbi:MAG TPA: hypothetical protein VGN51_19095 [Acidimicrobiia bacterium]